MSKTPQNMPQKFNISYYQPLRMWLLGSPTHPSTPSVPFCALHAHLPLCTHLPSPHSSTPSTPICPSAPIDPLCTCLPPLCLSASAQPSAPLSLSAPQLCTYAPYSPQPHVPNAPHALHSTYYICSLP